MVFCLYFVCNIFRTSGRKKPMKLIDSLAWPKADKD